MNGRKTGISFFWPRRKTPDKSEGSVRSKVEWCCTWCAHLAYSLFGMGFESSKADPDVWMRAASIDDDTLYNKYMLVYVDDVLKISEPK